VDIKELLDRANRGDVAASQEILTLQRQGRALRLYPNGRKDLNDDGVTPVIFGYNRENGLARIEMAKPMLVDIKHDFVATFMLHQMYVSALMLKHHGGDTDPRKAVQSIESSTDKDLTFRLHRTPSMVKIEFQPPSMSIEYGIITATQLLFEFCGVIEQSDLDLTDFGFAEDDDRYYDILQYASPVSFD
jgi:hypothetical protein